MNQNNSFQEELNDMRKRCRLAMNGVVSSDMRERGLNYKLNFGLLIPQIKEIAKSYQPNAEMAQILWTQETRELKILATLLYPPTEFDRKTALEWERGIANQEIREQLCANLLQQLPFASELAIEWANASEAETRVTGYWLMARLFITKKVNHTIAIASFDYLTEDLKNTESIFLRNAAMMTAKQIGRQSETAAGEVIKRVETFRNSDNEQLAAIFDDIAFEFEFSFNKVF